MHEIERKYNELSELLVDWVSSNGLSLNIKKTKYIIFSNIKMSTSNFVAKLASTPIEQTASAKFLGVIVDENLTWKYHIEALRTKMTRNAGILFKMKGILPQAVLKTLYHCFVQSHLNHCPLVWGMGSKHSLNPLFTAQKRAVRTLIPGFANYFYNKETGVRPCHTKAAFAFDHIPTIHNLILQRLLVFMHTIYTRTALTSMTNLFANCITPPHNHTNTDTHTIIVAPVIRLKPHKNSLFVKGPLLYPDLIQEIRHSDPRQYHSLHIKRLNPFKKCIKLCVLKLQSQGAANEWSANNFRLHMGSRRSSRTTITNNNTHSLS